MQQSIITEAKAFVAEYKSQPNHGTAQPIIYMLQFKKGKNWVTLREFFTEYGLEMHMSAEGHNYRLAGLETRTYVDHAFRCEEHLTVLRTMFAVAGEDFDAWAKGGFKK